MRPHPQNSRNERQSGGIIYLGDVRKRRTRRRQSPDRYYLAAFALFAVVFWAAWLTVVMTLAPARLLTYIAFFAPFTCALAATGTVFTYAVEWARGVVPAFHVCLRRGVLEALVIVVNLACLGAHFWLLPVAVVTIAAAVVVDLAFGTRFRF